MGCTGFLPESIAAARLLNRRAVLLIGDDRNKITEPLPPEIIAVNYAPFESLLPRGCAMIHHGGVGTTSQGLRAGIPTLIVPFAFDQPDNAAHAERMGTSRTLHRSQYKGERVAQNSTSCSTILNMRCRPKQLVNNSGKKMAQRAPAISSKLF